MKRLKKNLAACPAFEKEKPGVFQGEGHRRCRQWEECGLRATLGENINDGRPGNNGVIVPLSIQGGA